MSIVLDASAIVCWLNDEPGAVRVEAILAAPEAPSMHAVNFVEVAYTLRRRFPPYAQLAMERLEATQLVLSRQVDDGLIAVAIDLKVRFAPIALGDCFAVAFAATSGKTLITTDRTELEKVAAAGLCQIEFLR